MAEIEIRTCTEADWPAFHETMGTAFGGGPMPEEDELLWKRVIDFDKMIAATDGQSGSERMVGTAGWLPFDMAVPGGELPVAAVTMVTVSPTHRRRGILRQLKRRLFDDYQQAGVPVATLWASEPQIYQRFGYGLGFLKGRIEIDPRRAEFLTRAAPIGQARYLSVAEALESLPAVHERARRGIPASFRRPRLWWENRTLADVAAHRRGASPMFRMALEVDGEIEGYALYRITSRWGPNGLPKNEVDVLEALGTSPAVTRAVWQYLFSLDLITKVSTHRLNAQHPLFLGLSNVRQLQMTVNDGTWVRLVDAATALTTRTYACAGTLTVQLEDADCPWNDGVWTLHGDTDGATFVRSEESPDLRLSAAELSAMYLGTVPCSALLRAGRLDELAPGAARRADVMFHSEIAPWCLDDF